MVPARKIRQVFTLSIVLLGVVYLGGCSSSDERAEAHYQRGQQLVEKGEYVKASLEFRNAIKLKQDFVDALFALGDVSERQGNYEAAFKIYRSVAEQAPDNFRVRTRLSSILLAANEIKAARKYADEAVALSEKDPSALIAKAAVELKSKNPDEAVRLAKEALKEAPENTDAMIVLATERMMASDPGGALRVLETVPDSADRNIGLQLLKLSALDAIGDQPGVEHLFGKLVKLFPDNPTFLNGWTKWYLDKGRKDEAERIVRQFAADHPKDDTAQLNLISFLNQQKGAGSAISELEEIIRRREDQKADAFKFRTALAQLLFSSGKPKKAIELLESVVSGEDDVQEQNQARTILATMLVQTKDVHRAEQLANDILSTDDKNVDALRLRAAIKFSRDNYSSAAEDVLAALNEAPENTRLHAMLAAIYERSGSAILAEEQYAKAATLDKYSPATGLPMARFLLRYGKTAPATRVLETVRQRAPENRQVLELLAQLKLSSQDWIGAQEISQKLRGLDKGGNDNEADRIAAAALNGLNKHSDSIQLLQKTLANTGDQQDVLPDLIRAYIQAGRQSAAIAYLNSLIEKEPDNIQARVLLGSTFLTMGQTDDAEKAFKLAAADDSNGTLGDTALAQFYLTVGKVAEAEKAARTGLKNNPKSIPLRLLLTTVLQRAERFDDAIAEYEVMFKEDPESTIVANDLASLLSERRGDKKSLDRAFEIAQRFRSSEIPQYLDTLGWIYYLRGEYPSALPLLKSAAQRLNNVGLVQYHLGMVLKAVGQTEQAVANLEAAIKLKSMLTEVDLGNARAALEELKPSTAAAMSD